MRPTKRYIVCYSDGAGSPIYEWWCFAYDRQHAEEQFVEHDVDTFGEWTDWEILSVDRPRDGWGKVTTKYDRSEAGSEARA